MPETTPKPKISFRFPHAPYASHKEGIPIFFQQYGVKGILRVDVPSTRPCDLVKISLHGSISNRIGCGYSSVALAAVHARQENFLEMTDVHRLGHINNYKRVTSYQTPFWFEIPACGSLDHDICRANQYRLPPSLEAKNSDRTSQDDSTYASAEILYELRASVYQEEILISTQSQAIQLFAMATTIPPPLASDDFEGEYTCIRSRTLKKLFSKNRRLEISVAEPEPILLRLDGQSDIHRLRIICRLEDSSKSSPALSGTFSWRLKSTTIVSTIPLHSLPTSRQSMLCPFMTGITSMSQAKSTDLRLLDWQPSTKSSAMWDKTEDVWLTIPQAKDAVPSFFTPLVSRRYSLILCFGLKGDGNPQFEFEVPVQLIWTSDSKGGPALPCTALKDVGDTEEQCPLYTK